MHVMCSPFRIAKAAKKLRSSRQCAAVEMRRRRQTRRPVGCERERISDAAQKDLKSKAWANRQVWTLHRDRDSQAERNDQVGNRLLKVEIMRRMFGALSPASFPFQRRATNSRGCTARKSAWSVAVNVQATS